MTSLSEIGVRVEPAGTSSALGAGLDAVLFEIAGMLEQLAETGESGAIDLSTLPMAPGDLTRLREELGSGEVSMSLAIGGRTEVRETAVQGVWWITHYDQRDEVSLEAIEVAPVPVLIPADRDEILAGAATLRSRLADRHGGG
ncbi:MAG: hydrogenase expression/formation C-terminal domain-containing protein [Gammaproteobacteria bacterium]|jgi:hypothetical protein